MAWTTSQVFREWVAGPMMQAAGTGYTGLDSDVVNCALFNNTVVPDANAVVGQTAYGTGTWTTAREVTGGTGWAAKGRTLTGKTFTTSAGAATFTAANLASASAVTLTNVYGALIYDDSITGGTVADQGACFLYFGGSASVTSGSWTVVWGSQGIMRFEV